MNSREQALQKQALAKQDLCNHDEITNLGGKESGDLDTLSPVVFYKIFNLVCIIFHKRISDTVSGKFTLFELKTDVVTVE